MCEGAYGKYYEALLKDTKISKYIEKFAMFSR